MRRHALTLLELMISVAVVALLLGITLIVVGPAMDRARGIDDLERLRSIHQEFFAWGADRNDRFVNQGPPPPNGPFVLRIGADSGTVSGPYFMQRDYWTWVLASSSRRGERWWHPRENEAGAPPPSQVPAMPGREHVRRSSFRYSLAMLTDPAFWTYPSCVYEPAVKEAYYRYVRWSETQHPSAKALHFDSSALDRSGGVASVVSFVDGSVELLDWSRTVTQKPEDCPSATPVEATHLGILGRDFHR